MSIYGTIKELGTEYAQKQKKLVDKLTEKAPVLDVIPFGAASHGLWNVFEEVTDIKGAAFVAMNSPLPEVDATTDLRKTDMDVMGGKIYVPEDQAEMMGGRDAYFTKKLPRIVSKAGMDTERRMYYANFLRYAVRNGKAVNLGGTGDKVASIVAVRFEEEVTCGLYSPEGWEKGAALNLKPLNGGNLHTIPEGKFKGVEGYGMRVKGYFGLQIADERTVGALVNIAEDKLPTDMMIDDLLADVRADRRDTFLFMHPKVKNRLHRFKANALDMSVSERNYSMTIREWDDIPIITSHNILGFGESAVKF